MSITSGGHAWILASDRGAYAGDGFVVAGPDIGSTIPVDDATAGPELRFRVSFSETGTYRVWIRGWAADGRGDSVRVGFDGQVVGTAIIDGFAADGWSWSNGHKGAPVVLDVARPGIHTVHIWMREDGIALDRLVLTTDPVFTPEGEGPQPSDRLGLIGVAATPASVPTTSLSGDGTSAEVTRFDRVPSVPVAILGDGTDLP